MKRLIFEYLIKSQIENALSNYLKKKIIDLIKSLVTKFVCVQYFLIDLKFTSTSSESMLEEIILKEKILLLECPNLDISRFWY